MADPHASSHSADKCRWWRGGHDWQVVGIAFLGLKCRRCGKLKAWG